MRIGLAVLALAILATACSRRDTNDAAPPEEAQAAPSEQPADVQIVQVSVQGNAYVFSPASVQAGLPVRLVFDPTGLPGCSRSVTLPDYEITKTIQEGDETIEFTPESAGPVAVACTMNMFTGTLVAE
jgi:plastocyanin domain-containing protein